MEIPDQFQLLDSAIISAVRISNLMVTLLLLVMESLIFLSCQEAPGNSSTGSNLAEFELRSTICGTGDVLIIIIHTQDRIVSESHVMLGSCDILRLNYVSQDASDFFISLLQRLINLALSSTPFSGFFHQPLTNFALTEPN